MRAFDRLPSDVQAAISKRVRLRKLLFLMQESGLKRRNKILLVGDRPAPDAPDDARFHYTPFGAEHHSSLWLNLQLHQAEIPEHKLAWVNAYDHKGQPHSYDILYNDCKGVIALGGNAMKWIQRGPHKVAHSMVHHPQAWKRFHSKEPYPLIEQLKFLLDPEAEEQSTAKV